MGYSPAWLYRIEQGRVVPSAKVLRALAVSLDLDQWETRYLFALGRRVPEHEAELSHAPGQGYLDALHPNVAAWLNSAWVVQRVNAEFDRLMHGWWICPVLIYWHYGTIDAQTVIVNWEQTSQWCVGWLRFGLAAGHEGTARIVELLMAIKVFRAHWESQVIPVDPATKPWVVRDFDNNCDVTLDMRAWRPAGQEAGVLLLGAVVDHAG